MFCTERSDALSAVGRAAGSEQDAGTGAILPVRADPVPAGGAEQVLPGAAAAQPAAQPDAEETHKHHQEDGGTGTQAFNGDQRNQNEVRVYSACIFPCCSCNICYRHVEQCRELENEKERHASDHLITQTQLQTLTKTLQDHDNLIAQKVSKSAYNTVDHCLSN